MSNGFCRGKNLTQNLFIFIYASYVLCTIKYLNSIFNFFFIIIFLDIDECSERQCSRNAICTNTQGGYRCDCEPDTFGDPVIRGCMYYFMLLK